MTFSDKTIWISQFGFTMLASIGKSNSCKPNDSRPSNNSETNSGSWNQNLDGGLRSPRLNLRNLE